MSYTTDSDAYDQNVSPYLRRRLRTYDEALSERQAAWKADTLGQQQGSIGVEGQRSKTASAVSESERSEPGMPRVQVPTTKVAQGSAPCCNGTIAGVAPGPASRPAPHDVQSAVVAAQSRTLAGPLAMNDCALPAAAQAQEQRQPGTLGDMR